MTECFDKRDKMLCQKRQNVSEEITKCFVEKWQNAMSKMTKCFDKNDVINKKIFEKWISRDKYATVTRYGRETIKGKAVSCRFDLK